MNQNSTKLNRYFQSICHEKIEDIHYIFTCIEKKNIFDEIKKAQFNNQPLVAWINNPVKLRSGSNMVAFFYFNGSATSPEILFHLIPDSGNDIYYHKDIENYCNDDYLRLSKNLDTESCKVTFIVLEMKKVQGAGARKRIYSSSEEKKKYQIKFENLTENFLLNTYCGCGSNAEAKTICSNLKCKCKQLKLCCIKGKWAS